MKDTKTPRNAPVWVKVFVVFHLVCITMWSLPYPKKPYMQGTEQLGIRTDNARVFAKSLSETITEGTLYLNWKYLKGSPLMYYPGVTGFWQFWDMFSPNPASIDLYMQADVIYADKSKHRFLYPRMYTLPIPEKYVKERYRKFFENASASDQSYELPAVGQRIALECFTDPNNPPVSIEILTFQDIIEPPGTLPDPQYKSYVLFRYSVDQVKLRRDKGIAP
ncbi:MAG TPA: hypothetical protein VJ835_04405 [Fimbriimonadaceae bacterium]|nr:hypothetical protein [Fimbriimonadaceae bacterium]